MNTGTVEAVPVAPTDDSGVEVSVGKLIVAFTGQGQYEVGDAGIVVTTDAGPWVGGSTVATKVVVVPSNVQVMVVT